ncbi:FAR1-related sequence 10 [Tanacetum coccineum]
MAVPPQTCNLFSIKLHYGGRFTDSPNKQYVDGELCFVDMVDIDDFKVDLLNTVMGSISYADDDELLLYYKIRLKSLDVGLKDIVSDSDISNKNFIGYVKKHKIMDFYLKLVKKTESFNDEDGQSDSESEDANDFVDEEHLVEEVEVNMNSFNFQLVGEDETDFIDHIQPHVNVTEDDLEVLDFDSLESDQEDVQKNARSRGLRKLRKKHMPSGKEFANSDLAKERIRAYAVETRRNLNFKVNDKRRIRVVCNGVVPTLNSKNEYVDKVQGQKQDISEKDTTVKIDVYEEEDHEKTTRMFRRIYVCLGALKRGFKKSGRELLGLDGAFMRGQYTGHMLIAVGVDANNGIYLVAYGIVESENQYSWTWFLTCLADDFDLFTNSNFTSITDRQKIIKKSDGPLTPAVTKLFNKIKEAASIPCKHDIAAIHDMSDNDMETTKKRKKSKGEISIVKGDKLTRKGKTVTCSNCKGIGHNKRGCKAIGSSGGQMFDMPTREPVGSETMASQPVASQPMASQIVTRKHVTRKPVDVFQKL